MKYKEAIWCVRIASLTKNRSYDYNGFFLVLMVLFIALYADLLIW